MTGHGNDHINIDKGVTIDRVQFQMNAGDDTLDLKEGVTFKGGNIYLGSVDPSVFTLDFQECQLQISQHLQTTTRLT